MAKIDRKNDRKAKKIEEMGGLLHEREQKELNELLKVIDRGSITPESVKDVLPEAIVLKNREDTQLEKAFVAPTEKAIKRSTEEDSNVLAEALFPVIGPAIRKALSRFMRETIQSMNRSLERSISFKSIRWKLEALKTGKSFAEIALKESLVFRVEEVFLIHRKSGILLNRVTTENSAVSDADMVAAMLSAVQDFIRDSLNLGKGDAVDSFEVGDFVIWIEQSPTAVLALVIQGTPSPELRWKMQDVLETIHLQFGHILENFGGDVEELKETTPMLESCLELELKDSGSRFPKALVFILIVIIGIAGFFIVRSAVTGINEKKGVELLRAEPGIVITKIEKLRGKIKILGLRDPLSKYPAEVIARGNLSTDLFVFNFRPYISLEPEFVVKRAISILNPPSGVVLTFENGVLHARGNVSKSWIEKTKMLIHTIPGVTMFDTEGLNNSYFNTLEQLENVNVYFAPGLPKIIPGQESVLDNVANLIKKIVNLESSGKNKIAIRVIGHTTGQVSDAHSLELSVDRAKEVVKELSKRGVPQNLMVVTGVGANEPAVIERTVEDMRENRRVSFSVIELR